MGVPAAFIDGRSIDGAPRLSYSWAFKQPAPGATSLYRPEDIVVELGPSDLSYGAQGAPKRFGDYLLGDSLGEGSYGKVKEALNTRTHVVYAAKIMRWRQIRRMKSGEENVRREIALMKNLQHPNVVRLHEVLEDPDNEKLILILDLIDGGTLEQLRLMQPHARFSEAQARWFFKQLILGLEYIHEQGIAHRDVKPDNMMITTDGTLKLSDFSVAFPINETNTSGTSGAPAVQPPEVASGAVQAAGAAGDVWAAGVTLYLLTTGQYPFAGGSLAALFDNIAHLEVRPPLGVSPELQSLLRGILTSADKRMTIADIRRHPWMQLAHERIGFQAPRRTSFDGLRIDRVLSGLPGVYGGGSMDLEMSGMLSIDGPADEPSRSGGESTPTADATSSASPAAPVSTVKDPMGCRCGCVLL